MMLITIHPGATDAARQEITAYVMAYHCQTIAETAEAVTLLTMDADTAPVWMDMEYNTPAEITTDPEAITAAIMAA